MSLVPARHSTGHPFDAPPDHAERDLPNHAIFNIISANRRHHGNPSPAEIAVDMQELISVFLLKG